MQERRPLLGHERGKSAPVWSGLPYTDTAGLASIQPLLTQAYQGGGSSFGILISATMKTFPDRPVTPYLLTVNSTTQEATTNNNTGFYDIATFLTSELPGLSEAGFMGYYFITSLAGSSSPYASGTAKSSGPPSSTRYARTPISLVVFFFAIDTPPSRLDAAIAPFLARIRALPNASFTTTEQTFSFPSLMAMRPIAFPAGTVGTNALIGSRLWDERAVGRPGVGDAIRAVIESVGAFQGLFVSGPAVRAIPPTSVAVTPAWRSAYLHALGSITWPFGGDADAAARQDTETIQGALRRVAPNTGAYLNEADPFQPDCREAFWGANYPRLLEIKNRLDPKGVFWCSICVGAETWNQDQRSGRLCKI